jgi:predicted amidohydrolase
VKLKIGLAQANVALGNVPANVRIHRDWLGKARGEGVELLVFPELSLTGYLLQDQVSEVALARDAPELLNLAADAGPVTTFVGGIEESRRHAQYIACFVLEEGRVAGVHRKTYLASYGVFDEARFVGAGSHVKALPTRWGRVGVAICEDAWHPSLITLLLLDGAPLVVVQTASPVRDLRGGGMPLNAQIWMDTLRTYSRLYGCYIAFCNRVGAEDGLVFWGHSALFGPEGDVVAEAPLHDEALVVGEMDTERIREARLANPVLRDERLDLTIRELRRIGCDPEGLGPVGPFDPQFGGTAGAPGPTAEA